MRRHLGSLRRLGTVFLAVALNACSDDTEPATQDEPTLAKRIDASLHGESPAFRRVEKRIRGVERKLRADPDNANLHLELGKLLIRARLFANAEVEIRTALRLDPSLPGAPGGLVRIMLSRGELVDARRQLDEALEQGETAELHTLEAQWIQLSRPDDEERAARALSRALILDSNDVTANYELGLVHMRRDELGEAVTLFERVITADDTHLGAHFNLARIYRLTGDDEKADRAAARHQNLSRLDDLGLRESAGSLRAQGALAEMLISAGDFDGAVIELDAVIARFPNEPQPRISKAITLLNGGDEAAGLAAFEEALEAMPESGPILNRFALYLATNPGNQNTKRRALEMAKKAVSLFGDQNVDALQTLALAQVAVGDPRAARRTLKRAVKLDPNNPAPARLLAELGGREPRDP